MARVWIYEGRNSGPRAFWNFEDARIQQDIDNGCTLEDIEADPETYGSPEWGGSKDEGWFYIDDGGAITLVEVE